MSNQQCLGQPLRFYAALYQLDAQAKTATIYLMNTSKNRNGWGTNAKALDEAGPTLKGKPLGMGKGYRIDKHYPDSECMDSGPFVAFEMKGNYALGTARIEDDKTLQMLKDGTLKYTSVVIQPYSAECSKCQAEFKTAKEVKEHEHIKDGKGYEVVTSFTFHRVDFVDIPAYPQAGVVDLAASSQEEQTLLPLYAAFYENQAQTSQAQSSNGPNHSSKQNQTKGAHTMPEEKEFEKQMAALEQANKTLQDELKAAKTKAAEAEETQKALKAQLDEIVKEKHEALVDEVYKARAEALAGKEETEDKKLLAAIDDKTLQIMKQDALKVAQKVASLEESPGPKTRYGQSENSKTQRDALKAKMDQVAAEMGFTLETTQEVA
jgi:hypothetical protein